MRADIGLGGGIVLKALVGCCRDGIGAAKILGETLGPFELRGGTAWPECLDAGGLKIVDDTRTKRRFGSDHDQVDSALAAKSDDGGMVGQIERYALRLLRNAGIAWGAIKPLG